MGVLSSKYSAPYKYFYEVSKHKEVFDRLNIREDEVGKIYKCFKAIDVDDSGDVAVNEILIHLHMEKTFFNKRIFSLLDSDGSGELNFGEFLLGLWNFCSVQDAMFAQYAFDLYDNDKSGIIDICEAQFMVKDIYGKDFERSARAKKVYHKLAELELSELNFQTFLDFTQSHKAMLYPAFALQLSLKKYIMGKAFWKRQALRRLKFSNGRYRTLKDILGEDLFEKQFENNTLSKKQCERRRGSKTKSEIIVPHQGSRRGSHLRCDSMDSVASKASRRGSKDVNRNSRKSSKELDPSSIKSLRGKEFYQKLISGRHQEKTVLPEIRRHSRNSAVHPLSTLVSPSSHNVTALSEAVDLATMQQHVKSQLKMTTRDLTRKQSSYDISRRRKTHH